MVVAEDRLFVRREQERERPPADGQFVEPNSVERHVNLSAVEVVHPELIEVAQYDPLRPVRRQSKASSD